MHPTTNQSLSSPAADRRALSQHTSRRLLRQLEERAQVLQAKVVAERDRLDVEGLAQLEGAVGDDVDRAFVNSHIGLEHNLIERCLRELGEIAAARERLGTAEIGICADCDEPIGDARLEANPVATRCTECQDRVERMQRIADAGRY